MTNLLYLGIPERLAGMNIRWDYFVNQYDTARYVSTDGARDNRHIQFVREFASVVSILQVRHPHSALQAYLLTSSQDKTNNVIDLYKDILRSVEELSTCPYTPEAFRELLSKVQAAVCTLSSWFPHALSLNKPAD